ncbi:MAG: hypothetical protein OK442_00455 [Thaumarchaeota archaeon]|nr:hypothetical protein [Nitrososphaerota archaeon]
MLSSLQVSRAATSYVLSPIDPDVGAICASLGGSWDGSGTCTLGSSFDLGPGDSLVIDPAAVLAISPGVTLTNNGTVTDYGEITNSAGGVLANSGTITAFIANGTIVNDGSMSNGPDGSIGIEHSGQTSVQVGSFNFTNSGTLYNLGTIVDFGNLTNSAKASITNSGTFNFESATINIGKFSAPVTFNVGNFTNTVGGTVNEDGATINNTGIITNAGTFAEQDNVFSRINNAGTLTNNGTLTNYAYLVNVEGTIINSGTMSNLIGCAVVSCGTIANSGLVVNEHGGNITNRGNLGDYNTNPRAPGLGTLSNNGTLTNLDYFDNTLGGTTINSGAIDNAGTFSNMGTTTNSGSITSSGVILNFGYIGNNSSGSITNSRTLSNTGNISNLGQITNACGGVIDPTGTISGNPVAGATSCSSTTTPAPEFPSEALVPLLLSVLVLVSLAYGRGPWSKSRFSG